MVDADFIFELDRLGFLIDLQAVFGKIGMDFEGGEGGVFDGSFACE
jgi:hypothetical protein